MSGTVAREWFTAAELAELALPTIPTSKRGVLKLAEQERWTRQEWCGVGWRMRQPGAGIEFHLRVLPNDVRSQLALMFPAQVANDTGHETSQGGIWALWNGQTEAKQRKAKARLEALQAVDAQRALGMGKVEAMKHVSDRMRVQVSALYEWEGKVRGIAKSDWLPHLLDGHAGRTPDADICSTEAWDFLRSIYLHPERRTFADCYRRLVTTAKANGWAIASEKTLKRRMDALPQRVVVLARDGAEAMKRLFPAQERDRGVFHALEAVNADGHKWDVFVRWPDGHVGRPVMVAFQDLYSGKILSWRIDQSENKESVRLAFGDMIERHGIPDHCWLDNGRNFASKWLTGGTPNRYRFKVVGDEPQGVMVQMGVQVHWTTPYSGQSKPIERAFRDFAQGIAKHPAFAGAWTGNTPMAKPENYGNAAIPIEQFTAVVAGEIAAHNAREGRKSAVCNGRSFDDVFAESYAASPIRKASAAQRLLWLMAAEQVFVGRDNAAIKMMGNRYWHEALLDLRGERVTVRFDPQNMQAPLHVYRANGSYLVAAACIEKVGFNDADAAREHARKRNDFKKATKAMLAAERRLTIQEVAALLPEPAPMEKPPEPRVIRMAHGSLAVEADTDAEDEIPERERLMLAGLRQRSAVRGRPLMRIVEEEEEDPEADV